MRVLFAGLLVAGALTVVGSGSTADATTPCAVATVDRAQDTWINGSLSAPGRVAYYRFTTTSARYALITVGDLQANLAMTVYDSSCRVVATSDRSGTTFEQIYRSLSAGRYYVRVSGDSGAVGSYDVRFSSLTEGTHVLGYHSYTENSGQSSYIVGAALNNESHAVQYSVVDVYLYNSAGHLVAQQTSGDFPIAYAAARSRVPFIVPFGSPPPAYSRVAMSFHSVAPQPGWGPMPAVSYAPSAPWTLDGTTHYPGAITNVSSTTEVLGDVVVTLYDPNGNARYVTLGQVLPSRLAPKATAGFDATVTSPTEVNGRVYQVYAAG